MPTFSITVSNAAGARVVDAFTATYGYQATIDGAPNPETKAAFVTRILREHVKGVVLAHEATVAATAAREAAAAKVATEIVVT